MRKLFVLSLLVASSMAFAKAGTIQPYPHYNKLVVQSAQKYAYAVVVLQNITNEPKMWIEGKYVPKELGASIEKCTYSSQALDIMGDNGWELVSSLVRNINYGVEFFYYFKKPIN